MSSDRLTVTVPLTWTEKRDDGVLRVGGVAAPFNSDSEDLGFIERLMPGAFGRALSRKDNAVLTFQHDETHPLASVKTGSLKLRETSAGLEFDAELVDTSRARDLFAQIKAGLVEQCSFVFTSDPAHGFTDRWERGEDGTRRRFISSIGKLLDVSVVVGPAYQATSVAARSRPERLAALKARTAATLAERGTLAVRERMPYGPGSDFSWFRDKARFETATRTSPLPVGVSDGRLSPRPHGSSGPPSLPTDGPLEETRRRLSIAEGRALTTSTGGGGDFMMPTGGPPGFIADLFALSAKALGRYAAALRHEPMPAAGTLIEAPRLTAAASVAIETDGMSDSSTDPTTGKASQHYSVSSGHVDVDRQAFDRSNLDVVLAKELGELLGNKLDQQILQGTGANNQLLGLLTVTGVTTTTYTDASPTAAKVLQQAIAKCLSDTATARGASDGFLILLHDRRFLWLASHLGFDPGQGLVDVGLDAQFIRGQVMPVNLGAGTNQDPVIVLRREDIPLFAEAPQFRVFENPLSGNLRVRVQASQYSAFLPDRFAAAIGVANGTGLVTPTW